jgi:SAM-dependent methyltransferase
MEFDEGERFDIVLVHGTLQYLPISRRADVLVRLGRALRPAGRLVLLFHTSVHIAGKLASEARNGYADWVIAEWSASLSPCRNRARLLPNGFVFMLRTASTGKVAFQASKKFRLCYRLRGFQFARH